MAIVKNLTKKEGVISSKQTRINGQYTVDAETKRLKLETGTGNQNMVFEEPELRKLLKVIGSLLLES